jgi:hypothetical protein
MPTQEIKHNPYRGTPLARRMDDNLGVLDRAVKVDPLVTLPQLAQTALWYASGAICVVCEWRNLRLLKPSARRQGSQIRSGDRGGAG